MDLENISNSDSVIDISNLPSSQFFLSKIKTLQEKIPSILEDYIKYFVFYNLNPEYNEYQQMFENIKTNLQTINTDLVTIITDIEKKTENINHKLGIIDIAIKKEKDKNKNLKKKMGLVYNESNGTTEMINNFKDVYNNNYLKNWALFLGIILSIILLSTLFTSKTIEKNNNFK